MSLSSHVEPNTYSEAVKHDCWRKAIQCEISALDSNQIWETALLPQNKVVIGCKWVFKIKYKADGTIERYKASIPFTDIQVYRRLIGRLMYLTNTRPDITFFVQQLSQFLAKPTIVHYNAAIRILIYIKGAQSLGLFFSSTTFVHLKAFCDSDWGTCSDSIQSVTGFSVYLGNSDISWKSKKQGTISKSSCEVEYRGNDHCYM
ncbi:secreted RxLR effector protein 161-like [Phaseolus vulgaris]|uniref:secreted RxLR effector protein 161-like n=1 Tax=Phaseolus vulgaris TaxID=3885 RepID=UPI0035CB564E